MNLMSSPSSHPIVHFQVSSAMLSPAIQAIRALKSPFVPCKPEMISIGRTSVSPYPKVHSTMTDAEKVMVFQHNKTALSSANVDQCTWILTLADRINLMLTTKSSLANWERKLSCHWADFACLSILSWHNEAGNPINDMTMAADASILKPVQDGAAADCRSAGVKFVRVQLELDYTDLATQHGNFLGVDNLRALSASEVKRDLLDVTHQDGPYDLLAPNFNLTLCQTNSSTIYGELKLLVVCLALDTIHDTLFKVLVPGYSIKPHNVLDHTWQCYVDTKNKMVQLSAQAYYSTFLNAICSFYDLDEYPIDLAGIFQDHINPSLQIFF
jgi:hypothetical protein